MITIDPIGLNEAQGLLKTVAKIGKINPIAELVANQRQGESLTNADVLEYMGQPPGNRDFVSPDDDTKRDIDQTMLRFLERGINKEVKSGFLKPKGKGFVGTSKVDVKRLKGGIVKEVTVEKKARQIATRAFKEAALVWKKAIHQNIKEQKWKGGGSQELSDKYAKYKSKKFGFLKPIGVATKQVLEALAPNMTNIRFKTK